MTKTEFTLIGSRKKLNTLTASSTYSILTFNGSAANQVTTTTDNRKIGLFIIHATTNSLGILIDANGIS